MSTFMQKKENVVRKWYILDAAGKPMGKTAVAAADLLRGKNAPEFTPNVDCGNFVIIVNAEKIKVTGKKLDQKIYYHHSDYVGGMKETTLRRDVHQTSCLCWCRASAYRSETGSSDILIR